MSRTEPNPPAVSGPESGTAKPRRWVRVAMWIVAALILGWIILRLDRGQLLADVKRVHLAWFIVIVSVFAFCTLVLDTFTHHWVFSRFNPPARLGQVFQTRGETYLLLSLGFIFGQGGMAVAYSRRSGRPLGEVTGSIFFLMFNTLVSLMIFPTFALLLAASGGPEDFHASPEWRFLVRWLMICWPLVILHFAFWGRDWKFGLRRRAKTGAWQTFDRARMLDYLVTLLLRSAQVWMWVGFGWLGLRAADVHIPLFSLLVLGPIAGLASAIPTPARLGPTQAAWVMLFAHYATDEQLFAFSLLWTVLITFLRWLIGAVFLALPDGKRPR